MSENKENVSVDEMLKKMKRVGDDGSIHPGENSDARDQEARLQMSKGELVTRADGSEAIKVRSKKRRSHQPKKEKEIKQAKKKVVFISAAIVTLILLAIGFTILLGYFKGTKFTEKVNQTAENLTGAEVEIEGLDVNMGNSSIDRVVFDWSDSVSTLKKLELGEIHSDFGALSLIGGMWNGKELLCDTGRLSIELHKNPSPLKLKGEALLDFGFKDYKCNDLDIYEGSSGHKILAGTEATFSVDDKGNKQLYFYGGLLTAPFFNDYQISSGVVGLNPKVADVSLNLKSKSGTGSVILVGDVAYKENGLLNLETKLSNVLMDDWYDRKAKRFIYGSIKNGKGLLKMRLGNLNSLEVTTTLESRDIGISTFPFIETLSFEAKDNYFVRPVFQDESSLTVKWSRDKVEFTDINLVQKANFSLKGEFSILSSKGISGNLRIGIPIQKYTAKELKRLRSVFDQDEGDFIWTDIVVSGTLDDPKDNLQQKFAAKAGPALSPQPSQSEIFDQLNNELSN